MEKKITTANKVKSSSQRSLGFVHSLKGKMNIVLLKCIWEIQKVERLISFSMTLERFQMFSTSLI